MIKEKLEEIAAKFNGKYHSERRLFRDDQFSSVPVSYHYLDIDYKEYKISCIFEFGNSNMGEMKCEMNFNGKFPDFEIERLNHFHLLFKKNKNPWRIKCSNEQFQRKLENYLELTGINKLAQEVAFEPNIKGEQIDGKYIISVNCFMAFDNKENSFLPLFVFYFKLLS